MPATKSHISIYNVFPHFIIFSLLVLFFLNYNSNLGLEDPLAFCIGLLSCVLISLLVVRYKQTLLYLLAICVPLSITLPVIENSRISFPGELICFLLSLFFVFKLVAGNKISRKLVLHPITLLILADLIWAFVASCFSQMPIVSFKRLIIRSAFYIGFYYFYFELFTGNSKHIRKTFLFQIIGLLPVIGYALLRHSAVNFSTMWSELVSAPFYYDHTIYGACLAFFIPYLVVELSESQGLKQKLLYGVFAIIVVVAVVFSYSRAAWISLLIASFAFFLVYFKIKLKHLVYSFVVVLGILLLNGERVMGYIEKNREQSHSNDIGSHLKSISNIKTDASNKERINRWKCALRMFADKPVFGFGPGTYQFFYGKYQQRDELTRISTFTGNKGHAHSEYLNYLSESGLIGLVLFIALLVVVNHKCILLIQFGKSKTTRRTAGFIFMGIGTYIIHGFFNGFLEFDKLALPVYLSFAAIVALDLDATPTKI